LDIETGAIKQNLNNLKYYPKDVCIIGDYLFTVSSQSLPQIGMTTVIKRSVIYVFNKNTLKKIDELSFHGQTDSILVNGEDGFITVQGDDTVLHFKFINGKLSIIKSLPGFNFPHGISSLGNKVAITNYGDNSIRIFDINELKSL
jgi:hypothetical protein